MKIKHLLLGMLAMAATVACKPDQPVEEATLEVSKETVALAATAAEATFEVTSNQDWTATADADWVSLDPATGTASAEAVVVKVTAEDNEAAEARTATVTVKAGELTKTVALTQAGTEVVPAPEVDWTSEAVSNYELTEGVLRGIKYIVDDSYLHIKLQGSLSAINEYAAAGTPVDKLGLFVYDVINGSGNGFWGWWNNAAGNNEYEGESAGKFNGTDITLKVNGTEVPVEKEESEDAVVWTFSVPRSAHENLSAESFYFGILAYVGWDAAGAVPAKAENMFGYGVGEPEPTPVEPVTEGVIWENTNGVGPTSWQATTPYRFSIEGGDSQNECIAEIPAAVWAGMKTTPFTVKITPDATKEWWQVRILDGWWSTDDGGTNDITPEYAGLVNYGDGTYAFQVDLSTMPELSNLIDTKHLLFTGDAYTINKIYFGEPEPAPVDVDIDGKQWLFTWNAMGGAECVIDLGVTEPGIAILAYDMGVLDPSYAGIAYPYIMGTYTVTKTDGTSGVVTLTVDGMTEEIPYSNATENSVHFATAALLEEDVDCTLATSKVDIYLEVAEYLPDGEYWIIADGKVATPLTSNYGYLQVVDAVDGKSYAANAFTFTQVEAGLYTIQDANGKYYYQTGTYNSFNVSDKDGGTDEYLWEVYDTGNGQYAIINYSVGKFVQYDASYNSYGSYADEKGTLPTLVLAENPIPEPEPEPEPEPTPTPEGACYVKVTADQEDWSGKYLIVWGTNAHASLASGAKDLNSTAAVTIEDGVIAATDALNSAVMTVTKNGDKYNMTFADGKYFAMQHNGCLLSTTAFDLDFAYTTSGVKVSGYVAAKSATYILYYNSNNGSYYRCYVDKNGQSGYTLPTLYKYTE